jgi:hypothetical protein
VTPAILQAASAEIATTQGALRLAHLRYHLSTLDVLPPSRSGGTASFVVIRHWRVTGTGPRATPKASLAPRVNASAPIMPMPDAMCGVESEYLDRVRL